MMKPKAMILKRNGKVAWRTFDDAGVAYLDLKKEDAYFLRPEQTSTDTHWGVDYQVAVYCQGNPEPLAHQSPQGLTSKHLASLLGPKLSLALRSAMFPKDSGVGFQFRPWMAWAALGLGAAFFILNREGLL